MSYLHFTLDETKFLQFLLACGFSFRKIAGFLGRNVSSVSREVHRNSSKYPPKKKSDNPFFYHPWRAQNLYIRRRRESKHFRLLPDTDEWCYITQKLTLFWSPEQICNRWKLDFPEKKPFSPSTVYRYIAQRKFAGISAKTHLRRRGKRFLPRASCYNSIQPDRTIPQWPDDIKHRLRLGDWEGDTVYGGVGKGLLVTFVDRKSRYLVAALLPKRDAALTKDVIINMMRGKPVKSISLDNGSEFLRFREIEKELGTEVYFAEPHKPWQRGTNENTNDILRFFL